MELSTDEDTSGSNEDQHNRGKEFSREEFEAECKKSLYLDGQFFTVDFDKSSWSYIYGRCNFCEPAKELKFLWISRGNLKTHLKNLHPKQHEEYKKHAQSKKKNRRPKFYRQSRTCSSKSLNRNIMNYILESMAPLNTVEKKSFKKIFDDLKIANFEHMTEDSLSRMITRTFKDDIKEIRKTVAKVEYVCATVDAWARNNERFLGVTLHWIDEKTYKRKSAAIACKRFPGRHSNSRNDIHYTYNLTPDKIDAAVNDNESNFVKEFKMHGLDALDRLFSAERSVNVGENGRAMTHIVEDFSSDDPTSEKTNFSEQCQRLPEHLRCASYTLQDVAITGIIRAIRQSKNLETTHSRVLKKCGSLWDSLRSPNTNKSLRNYLGTALIAPVMTRWKSFFDACQQLVTLKPKLLICTSGDAHGITLRKAFTESDFGYLGEYIRSTKPLAEVIDQLQDEAHCYYGYLLPTLVNLRNELLSLQNEAEITICHPLVVTMLEVLETRFEKMFEFSDEVIAAAIAAVAHPKFKASWLSHWSPVSQKLMYDHVIKAVTARIELSIISDPEDVQTDDSFHLGGDRSVFEDLATQNATVIAKVTQYLTDPDEKLDMLKNHPVMQRLFLEFNAPLLSSAPVERLFSDKMIGDLSKLGSSSDRHFERRVVAAANLSKYYL